MRFWIVECQYGYEGSDFIGAYSTEEKALEAQARVNWGDRIVIQEVVMDQTNEYLFSGEPT